jgi:multidrug efflux pump subunit AcrA (membrane-fusion protein)
MPVPVFSLPANAHQETIDFLRRLSSMLTGGRNAEMLLEAAKTIETLSGRATTAEQLFQEQQEDHARSVELREVAKLASDNLIAEMETLKAQLDAEVASLKAQLDVSRRQAEADRNFFGEEALRLQAQADVTEARLAQANAELDGHRQPIETGIDESIAVVPIASLQLARTQFDYLAEGFAGKGDLVSQTICEIGARAIDKALASNELGKDGG